VLHDEGGTDVLDRLGRREAAADTVIPWNFRLYDALRVDGIGAKDRR